MCLVCMVVFWVCMMIDLGVMMCMVVLVGSLIVSVCVVWLYVMWVLFG